MKLYRVSIDIEACVVVLAEDEDSARRVARSELGEILDETDTSIDIHAGDEITSSEELPRGWDDTCSPYSARGAGSIGSYLAQIVQAEQEGLDDRTIDMFSGKALIDG